MDPYQVLGVSPGASDEEIKTAYRRLTQLYHPDRQAGNKVMEEVATQKMTELNAAYDQIMNMRRSGMGAGSDLFAEARRLIESGSYTQADNILEGIRQDSSAEWNYLKGAVCLSRGWMNDAYSYFEKAVRLDPSKSEYRAAFDQIRNRQMGNMRGNPYSGRDGGGMDTANCLCNACQFLMCADCLCDCINCF